MKTALLLFGILSMPLHAAPDIQGVVEVTNIHSKKTCLGVFLESQHNRALFTSAHCLGNFMTGGLELNNGMKSEDVVVFADAIAFATGGKGDYSINSFFDGAIVLFPIDPKRKVAIRRSKPPEKGDKAWVGVFRKGTSTVFETEMHARINNTQIIADKYKTARIGDGGAPIFDDRGRFMGALRGCNDTTCGFFPAHSSARYDLFRLAELTHPGLFP